MHAICCVCNLNRKETSGGVSFFFCSVHLKSDIIQYNKVSYFNCSWFPEDSHLIVESFKVLKLHFAAPFLFPCEIRQENE